MIHRAIKFAAVAHKGQWRKGARIPYIVHPFEVAQILTAMGASEALIVAGLLHDTLEDTATTPNELKEAFGESVLRLVLSATERKEDTWEERKLHTIQFLKTEATYEQKQLALADKLSNLRSIALDMDEFGDQLYEIFNRGKKKQHWYYKSLGESLQALNDIVFYKEFCELIEKVFEN
ncbi:HD domain-containing protein [Christensenellaceae bacterium OttesenSCG-928-M15]|nr:HD domain-containing protein [Christensenellaceae bacterium OttesenSCG-928-M15]